MTIIELEELAAEKGILVIETQPGLYFAYASTGNILCSNRSRERTLQCAIDIYDNIRVDFFS